MQDTFCMILGDICSMIPLQVCKWILLAQQKTFLILSTHWYNLHGERPCHVPTLIRGTGSELRPLHKLVTLRDTKRGTLCKMDTATGLTETALNKRNGEAIHYKVQEISSVKGASWRERETCRWKDWSLLTRVDLQRAGGSADPSMVEARAKTHPHRPWDPPSLLQWVLGHSPVVKQVGPGEWGWPPTPIYCWG